MQRYTPRDIVVLVLIAGLVIWSFGVRSVSSLEQLAITIAALLCALTFHEFSHAAVALYLGDATAKMLGRVSLNPIRHLDLFGSLAFLFVGFGWGKPVPINPYNMRTVSPLVGAAISAIAGPVSNVVLAFLATIPLRLGILSNGTIEAEFIGALFRVNVALAAFNFLPIPPLDGFSLARLVLPYRVTAFLEQYGMLVLLALVFVPSFLGPRFDILRMVTRPLQALIQSIVLAGL